MAVTNFHQNVDLKTTFGLGIIYGVSYHADSFWPSHQFYADWNFQYNRRGVLVTAKEFPDKPIQLRSMRTAKLWARTYQGRGYLQGLRNARENAVR